MIKKLKAEVVEKIAAGEVIEQPANIVKELIENSIDAQATQIDITIENGGKTLIQVTDNGTGMSQEDIALCLQPHTTSKIETVEDLYSISSLGFRGEALASMAAVSKVSVTTKKADSIKAYQIDSESMQVTVTGAADGTTITIKDLFYNTPARKKFLRSDSSEVYKITRVIQRYAMSNPSIGFTLTHNKKSILSAPIAKDAQTRIAKITGQKKDLFIPITSSADVKISGVISKPQLTRSDRNGIYLYINKRSINDPKLTQAILIGYDTYLMKQRYPYAVLHITIDTGNIDVNVHPQKEIVKFSDELAVFNALRRAIATVLKQVVTIPTFTYKPAQTTQQTITKNEPGTQEVLEKTTDYVQSQKETIRYIGIVAKTYVVGEFEGQLVLVDFHAAHERFNYEKFMDELQQKVETQACLEPLVFELSAADFTKVLKQKEQFKAVGLDFEEFGSQTLILKQVPILFKPIFTKDFIIELIESADTDPKTALERKIQELVSTIACKASDRAGDDISDERAKQLLRWLLTTEYKYACPHGRPTMVKLTRYELEKMFSRVV